MGRRHSVTVTRAPHSILILLPLVLMGGLDECSCDPVTDALSCPSSGSGNRPRCEVDDRGEAVAVNCDNGVGHYSESCGEHACHVIPGDNTAQCVTRTVANPAYAELERTYRCEDGAVVGYHFGFRLIPMPCPERSECQEDETVDETLDMTDDEHCRARCWATDPDDPPACSPQFRPLWCEDEKLVMCRCGALDYTRSWCSE